MPPLIRIFGGVHNDPGSRRRFLQELAGLDSAPHFVAVEWESAFFRTIASKRQDVMDGLRSRWSFLTPDDCIELACALGWEGDAFGQRFAGAECIWLEEGFQTTDLARRYGEDAASFPSSCARGLLNRLSNPCKPTMREFMDGADAPPEPGSKNELVDRVWRKAWSDPGPERNEFERDERWAARICERTSGLQNGWVAVVVGWAHADPLAKGRLHDLLTLKGLSVAATCLGPLG